MRINQLATLRLRLGAALALLGAGCASPGGQTGPAVGAPEAARADLSHTVERPIPVNPFLARTYREKYLPQIEADTAAVFAVSPNGNRSSFRVCPRPACQLSEAELAARALDRCNVGVPRKDPALRCVVFDRNGAIQQPHRFWTDADFDFPAVDPPPPLAVTDPAALAPARYVAMTPDGQLVISLRPPAPGESGGRAYFWDTGDGFHQGTWSLRDGAVCVDSVDGRSTVTCGRLHGPDMRNPSGVTLDLFPGKYLPVTRLQAEDQ